MGNCSFIQSTYGIQGNFEVVVVPAGVPGLLHFERNNDAPGHPWSAGTPFGETLGIVDGGVSMIQGNMGATGNLEVVACAGGSIFHFWRDSGPDFDWHGPDLVSEAGFFGYRWPSLVQSQFGVQGNFELVVGDYLGGGFTHFWRNNDAPGYPWGRDYNAVPGIGIIDGLSLITSNFAMPPNLEFVALSRGYDALVHMWRVGTVWQPIEILALNNGSPSLTQGNFGMKGNFELVINLETGGFEHFSRNNDPPALPWSNGTIFADIPVDRPEMYGPPSLIQSNYGVRDPRDPGSLEVMALTAAGTDLVHWYRPAPGTLNAGVWQGPDICVHGI